MHALSKWLSANHKTQVAAAADFGITQHYLSEIINRVKRPSLEVALRISKATGITVEELFADEPDPDDLPKQPEATT